MAINVTLCVVLSINQSIISTTSERKRINFDSLLFLLSLLNADDES